jgi:hypothetical protein
MKFTNHFINDVKPKRPYLDDELLSDIIENPIKKEIQDDNKIKLWGYSSKHNKYVRVILLEDGETIDTAFFDRNFKI